jgi:hypothetical protein
MAGRLVVLLSAEVEPHDPCVPDTPDGREPESRVESRRGVVLLNAEV